MSQDIRIKKNSSELALEKSIKTALDTMLIKGKTLLLMGNGVLTAEIRINSGGVMSSKVMIEHSETLKGRD